MDFQQIMPAKTDEQLQQYLDNYTKYVPEAIEAAFAELKIRGRNFSEEEALAIETNIANRRKELAKEQDDFEKAAYDKNIVEDDLDAPMLYSQTAIGMFSLFFASIAGTILMYNNLKDIGKKKEASTTLVLGIAYTVLSITLINMISRGTSLAIPFNVAGALIINKVLWPKYISETKYKAKPIWKPLIIWVLIMIPFILAAIYVPE